MRQVTLEELKTIAEDSREAIWEKAESVGREPTIYLHWSAGHYGQFYDDYHINIDEDGSIYISTNDFSETLAHTWKRNTGAVGIAMACCAFATTNDLGDEPPTPAQIESMAQVIAVVADSLWLTIDKYHVLTHSEAADNYDDLNIHEDYGAYSTAERWDLLFLGTDESPSFPESYDDPTNGGNVLRGKANFYRNQNMKPST